MAETIEVDVGAAESDSLPSVMSGERTGWSGLRQGRLRSIRRKRWHVDSPFAQLDIARETRAHWLVALYSVEMNITRGGSSALSDAWTLDFNSIKLIARKQTKHNSQALFANNSSLRDLWHYSSLHSRIIYLSLAVSPWAGG